MDINHFFIPEFAENATVRRTGKSIKVIINFADDVYFDDRVIEAATEVFFSIDSGVALNDELEIGNSVYKIKSLKRVQDGKIHLANVSEES